MRAPIKAVACLFKLAAFVLRFVEVDCNDLIEVSNAFNAVVLAFKDVTFFCATEVACFVAATDAASSFVPPVNAPAIPPPTPSAPPPFLIPPIKPCANLKTPPVNFTAAIAVIAGKIGLNASASVIKALAAPIANLARFWNVPD